MSESKRERRLLGIPSLFYVVGGASQLPPNHTLELIFCFGFVFAIPSLLLSSLLSSRLCVHVCCFGGGGGSPQTIKHWFFQESQVFPRFVVKPATHPKPKATKTQGES